MEVKPNERGILFAVTGGTENFLERRGPGPQGALGGPKGAPGGPQGVILLDGFRAEFRAPEGEIGREFHPCEALGELYLSRGVPGVVLFSTPSKKRPPKRPRFLERRGLCTPKVCPSVHNKIPRSNLESGPHAAMIGLC